ncbi:GNAT family N-acetyltransferase [Bacillus fonticola]|uniref:GNAT family N-acetyltransferase n=1 Tax=Bacillus fonticola TaxID=2728853 RepID=UPI001474D42A|nr:GNAT family N-acetyltransferase [Bacillus fonticola]
MKAVLVTDDKQLQDAFSVRKEVFIHEQYVPEEEEIDHHEGEATHIVLYDNNTPVGAGRFRIVDGKGKVERICVLQSHRGRGAGKMIMDAVHDEAAKHGVQKLVLNAQTHAIPFYERLGYLITSAEFLDAGIPHKSMEIIQEAK